MTDKSRQQRAAIMANRSMGTNPFVFRVKSKEDLKRLKQLECLIGDIGKEAIIGYLEHLVSDKQKVVQSQVPKNMDIVPTPAVCNKLKDAQPRDDMEPEVEIPGKFSYDQFLTAKDCNKITFEEFVTAAHRWGANVVGGTTDDLKGYLSHLSLVSAKAATRKYDQQMHVDYDKAIRKKAEEVGWAAFKADNTTVANLYYDTENKEQHYDELDTFESDSEQCSVGDPVLVDENQSTEPTSETVDMPLAIHENLAVKKEMDVKDSKCQSFCTVSKEDNSVTAMDGNTGKLETASGESGAHSSVTVVSEQFSSDVREASIIPKPHICSHCSKEFGSATTLKGHLRKHAVKAPAKKKIHLCSICGKEFKLSSYLKQHMRHHTGERPYPCTVCGERLISASTLSEHMLRHTGNKGYVCSYCGKQFYSSSALTIHTRIHTGEKPHVCPYCGKGFRGSGYMKSHMLVHTQEKPHKCSKCGRGFSTSCNLKRHMVTHTGEKPYKCPHCSKACAQPSALKAHINLWHTGEEPTRRQARIQYRNDEKAHTCSECGKLYRYLFTLKMHMITHTGGNALTCPDCGKTFSALGQFRSHMMGHTGEKPYECKVCGKGFPSSTNLDLHALVHTGEKPYVCSDCGNAFSSPANLQKHKKIHTGEKPHVCSDCGKAFGQKSGLQLHVMIHTGEKPFVCSECGKGFSRAVDLRKHMKIHGKKE